MRTCLAWARMRGYGWLVLSTALVATGCATAPRPLGPRDTSGQQAAVPAEVEGAAETSPVLESSPVLGLDGNSLAEPRVRPLEFRQRSRLSGGHRVVKPSRPRHKVKSAQPPPSVPAGWPQQAASDDEVLAPLLACASVGDFLALQRGVDMARVLERLKDWNAVRLGALGPLADEQASQVLTRKRASFLLDATEEYGAFAQVFALFILHTSHDDELRPLLRLLAHDKQLTQTLGNMEAVRQELERRGLKLEHFPERGEQASDVLRGLGQATREALNSSPMSDGARHQNMMAQARQLPPAYQQALVELGLTLILEHYGPGNSALGPFDQMTFGVPLGFYHLAVGTVHGGKELLEGHYEQATRELAPAALMVALYAGGKGSRYVAGLRMGGVRLRVPALQLEALRNVAWQVSERLGLEGLAELARYIRASREAAVFVGAGGEPAAVALYEARGNVARAQAWLSEARPERAGAPEPRATSGAVAGGVAALVDAAAGHTVEVVEAKLLQAEVEAQGPRLPADAALLRKLNDTLAAPPPGVPEGYTLWNEYLTYRQRRLAELEQGKPAEGPLRWQAYEAMRMAFARGLAFERAMVAVLRADAALSRAQRQWLQGFNQPRIEVHVGVSKPGVPGLRFADVLVIEGQPPPGQPPRVETFSFKSRNLAPLEPDPLADQMKADARAALEYYGGTVDILRPGLRQRARVEHVRLVYEGGALKPRNSRDLNYAVLDVQANVKGVEVLFQ